MTIPYRKVLPPESASGRETPGTDRPGGWRARPFPCGRQGTAAPTVGGDHGQPFYIFYILYAVKFISRREASQSCQSCLKFLLHVLLISTANIDRFPSLICILYIFCTVPPPPTILHLYTANYRAGGRGLPPLPLEATHGHTFYIFYILCTVNSNPPSLRSPHSLREIFYPRSTFSTRLISCGRQGTAAPTIGGDTRPPHSTSSEFSTRLK